MRRRLLLATLALAGGIHWGASATAATFDVVSCGSVAPGGQDDAWQYRSSAPPGTYIEQGPNGCAADPADRWAGRVVQDRLSGGGAVNGDFGEFRLTAPAGTEIVQVDIARFLEQVNDSGWRLYGRAGSSVLEDCQPFSGGCTLGTAAPNEGESLFAAPDGATQLQWGIDCNVPFGGCSAGALLHSASATIYRSRVTIDDLTHPTLGAVTSPLFTSAWQQPTTANVTAATAVDVTGIKTLSVVANGTPAGDDLAGATTLATQALTCDYSNATDNGSGVMVVDPCPHPSGAQALSVNTAALPDGQHALRFRVTDAAGNPTLSAPHTIKLDGTPPPPPTNLTVGVDGDARPTLRWQNPGPGGAPLADARWTICPEGRLDGCSSGVIPATETSVSTPPLTRGSGRYTVRVSLSDAAGNVDAVGAATTITAPAAETPGTPPSTSPPIQPPAPSSGLSPTPQRVSPGLRISSLRTLTRRRVRVTLTLTRAPGGEVTVIAQTRRGREYRKVVMLTAAHGRATFTLRRGDRIARVTAQIAAQPGYTQQRVVFRRDS